jgi:hypothetical protein
MKSFHLSSSFSQIEFRIHASIRIAIVARVRKVDEKARSDNAERIRRRENYFMAHLFICTEEGSGMKKLLYKERFHLERASGIERKRLV